jgi:hypothetical protein
MTEYKRVKLDNFSGLLIIEWSERNPLPGVRDTLHSHCTHIMVDRSACRFADELELPWAKIVHPYRQRLGSALRWMLCARSGALLSLKK